MKKLLTTVLALVLCLGLMTPALAAEGVYVVEGQAVETIPAGQTPELGIEVPPLPVDWMPSVDPDREETLTLAVNGISSDVAVTAVDGVSYADADALRTALGDEKVAAGQTGQVAIRPAAEAAGLDVVWYDGGWRGLDQEIQLWDRKTFEDDLDRRFGSAQKVLDGLVKVGMEQLRDPQARRSTETVDLTLTRFSTLDGDKTYTARLTLDILMERGVLDYTLTFDVSDFLRMFTAQELEYLAKNGQFDLAKLTGLLRAGKVELLLDMNTGEVALNAPLLALIDPELEGWQVETVPGLADSMKDLAGQLDLKKLLYDSLTERGERSGAAEALTQYVNLTANLEAFAGEDCFRLTDTSMTYTLNTRRVNQALSDALRATVGNVEFDYFSFFKSCDISLTLSDRGTFRSEAHIRPDVEGIAFAGAAASEGEGMVSVLLRGMLSAFDVEMKSTASGNGERATQETQLHWNNVGRLQARTVTVTGSAKESPRKIADVKPAG